MEDDSDELYPPYTGHEFLASHESIDEHDYSLAFGQFLSLGLDADIANILAFGDNRFDLISPNIDNPLRMAAFEVYDRLCEMGYWCTESE
ncbi:MAG TPA: hypothetical protein V6D11_11340 [Waterburya sp.]